MADASGAVHTKIGPLQETVLQLAWADGSTLIGGTAGAINTWTHNGSQLGPVLRNLSPSPYLLFATSPDSRFLAVVCTNKEVCARGGGTPYEQGLGAVCVWTPCREGGP